MQPTPRPTAAHGSARPGRRPAAAPAPAAGPRRWPRPATTALALAVGLGLAACSPAADGDAGGPGDLTGPTGTAGTAETPGGGTGTPTASAEPDAVDVLPTPDEHSAVGELADGFPATLLPLPEDAEILVSTWAPEGQEGAGQPYAVSLNATTALPAADVAALYRASLTAAGFAETVGTPAGLAAGSTYSRSAGAELLTVGVLDRGGVRTVTVGGRLRADA